jgi:hypothetical protein
MPGLVPPFEDEREGLLAYLAQQRYNLRVSAYGLTDEQARKAASPSALTVGGLIKHLTLTEIGWIDTVLQVEHEGDVEGYLDSFRVTEDETLAGLLDGYDAAAARSESVARDLALDHPVPVPHDAPWFPRDVEAWSLRWVLLHLIEETAKHAGHADIIREAVDGATFYPLMAAVEGWPAADWLQPWEPAS